MNNCEQLKVIMQGDSYYLPITLTNNGEPIDVSEFKIIEFNIGNLTKYWKPDGSGEVRYNKTLKNFELLLTQEETFAFRGKQKVVIRVQDYNNYVAGREYGYIEILYNSQGGLLQ